MLRFTGDEILRLLLGLAGALLLAAALASLADPSWNRTEGGMAFFAALAGRVFAIGQGDFGISLLTGISALDALGRFLPATLSLLTMGLVVALALGLPLGLLMGFASVRRLAAPVIHLISALPVFCAGLLLAYGAYHGLGWHPAAHPAPLWPLPQNQAAWLEAVLPVMTVGLAGVAAVQRALRRAISQEDGALWPDGLVRLGISVRDVQLLYRLPRLLAGLIAAAGEIVLALLAAAVVAEWVFRCPGAANMLVKAAALGDGDLAALILFAFAGLVFCAHFLGRLAGFALASEMVCLRSADLSLAPQSKLGDVHLGLRLLGWAVLSALAVAALLHEFLSPVPPDTHMVGPMLSPPSVTFPFGTDVLGRDIYSETLHGLSVSMGWSLVAALIAISVGGLFGAVSARLPLGIASSLRWLFGVLAAFPALVLAIAMIWLISRGPVMAVAAGLAAAPMGFVRAFDRADARSRAAHAEFARATGLSLFALIRRDIRAELQAGFYAMGARTLAAVAIIVSTVGFLGFGPPPPLRDLGAMIASAKEQYLAAWWTAAFPASILALIVLSARLAAGLDEGERP